MKISEADRNAIQLAIKAKRLRGEWFDLNEDDIKHIKSLDWRSAAL